MTGLSVGRRQSDSDRVQKGEYEHRAAITLKAASGARGGSLPQLASVLDWVGRDVCERSSDLSRAYARVGSSGRLVDYSAVYSYRRAASDRPAGGRACRRDFLSRAIAPLTPLPNAGDHHEHRPMAGLVPDPVGLLICAGRAHLLVLSVDD